MKAQQINMRGRCIQYVYREEEAGGSVCDLKQRLLWKSFENMRLKNLSVPLLRLSRRDNTDTQRVPEQSALK